MDDLFMWCGITLGSLIQSLPPKLDNVLCVTFVVTRLTHCRICLGNAEGKKMAYLTGWNVSISVKGRHSKIHSSKIICFTTGL